MTSPSFSSSSAHMQPLSTSMLGGASVASSHAAQSGFVVPLSAMAGDSTHLRRPIDTPAAEDTPAGNVVGNALFSSPQTRRLGATSDLLATGTAHIPRLGRGSESGPATADIGGRLFGTPDSEVMTRSMQHRGLSGGPLNAHTLSDFDTPGLTPITSHRLSADRGEMSAFHLQMSVEGDNDGDEAMANPFRSAAAAGGHDGTRRRVSFGPAVVNSPPPPSSALAHAPSEEDNGPEDSPGIEDPPPRAKNPRTSRLSGEGARSRIPRARTGHAPSTDSLQQSLQQGRQEAPLPRGTRGSSDSIPHRTTRGRSGSSSLSPTRPSPTASRASATHTQARLARSSLSPARSPSAVGSKGTPSTSRTARSRKDTTSPPRSPPRSPIRSTHAKGGVPRTSKKDSTQTDEPMGDPKTLPGDSNDPAQTYAYARRALVAEGEAMVLSLLVVFGEAYRLVSMYQCLECIRHLQLLPRW